MTAALILGAAAACLGQPKSCAQNIAGALESLASGETRQSADSIRSALACDANEPLAHVALGMTLLTGGRPEDAMLEFAAAEKLDPNCADAIYGSGLSYLAAGKFEQAIDHLARAQAADPSLDARGALEYAKAVAGNVYNEPAQPRESEALQALDAFALTSKGNYAEALEIWRELQRVSARPGSGERIGCAMTFVHRAPLALTGWPLPNGARVEAAASKARTVSGVTVLRADMREAQGVRMVLFFVDGVLVGMTNAPPFEYDWDSSRVSNGSHTLKVQGLSADEAVLSEKSTEVVVKNAGAASSTRLTGAEADRLWKKLRGLMTLRPSVAAIDYNLALCAVHTGDRDLAAAALERVMAADPDYLDAADRLAALYGSNGKGKRLYKGDQSKRVVALTFDDGPNKNTYKLLQVLRDKNVKATFFVVGKQVEANPDVTRRISDEGHEIENHTYGHRALEFLSTGEIEQEVFKNCAAVRAVTGKRMRRLRPPEAARGPRWRM